jgi:hypothetical protein
MRKQMLGRLALAAAVATSVWAGSAPARAQDTKITGRVYADFTDKENKDDATGVKSGDSGVGTDVKRFYIGVSHTFDSVWSANFVSDIGDQGTKRYDLFVKKAYIQAKVSPQAIFQLGSADTAWIPYVEGLYGYRYIEQTLIDRFSFGASADWGLHFNGKSGGNGLVNYQISAENGRGFSNPSRSKNVDFEGRLGIQPIKGLNIAVGGYSGKRGLETDASPAKHTASRFDATIGYVSDHLRIGGEYMTADNWTAVTNVAKDKADGTSAWVSFAFTPQLGILGRYDSFKPNKDTKPNLKDTYYNLGLEYRVNKAFQAALVYKYEKVEGGTISTGNGTIGSTVPTSQGKYNELGVWTVYNF